MWEYMWVKPKTLEESKTGQKIDAEKGERKTKGHMEHERGKETGRL